MTVCLAHAPLVLVWQASNRFHLQYWCSRRLESLAYLALLGLHMGALLFHCRSIQDGTEEGQGLNCSACQEGIGTSSCVSRLSPLFASHGLLHI